MLLLLKWAAIYFNLTAVPLFTLECYPSAQPQFVLIKTLNTQGEILQEHFAPELNSTQLGCFTKLSPRLLNNCSSIFLIIIIKIWQHATHHLYYLFVILLFTVLHVHHKKAIFKNGFINNCDHNASNLNFLRAK